MFNFNVLKCLNNVLKCLRSLCVVFSDVNSCKHSDCSDTKKVETKNYLDKFQLI